MNTAFERGGANHDGKDEWLTPPSVLATLGDFDLDPCAPILRPWDTAKQHYTYFDDGLARPWHGRVFCNPPYGSHAATWLKRCAEHKNAIALVFARTETKMFFDEVWSKATAILFIKGRLRFHHVTGEQGGTAGSPSCLIAYDSNNALWLKKCGLGRYIELKP